MKMRYKVIAALSLATTILGGIGQVHAAPLTLTAPIVPTVDNADIAYLAGTYKFPNDDLGGIWAMSGTGRDVYDRQ